MSRDTRTFSLYVLVTTTSIVLPSLLPALIHSLGFRYYRDKSYIKKGLIICVLCKVAMNYYIYYAMIKSYTMFAGFYSEFWYLIWGALVMGLFLEYYLIAWLVNKYILRARLPDIN